MDSREDMTAPLERPLKARAGLRAMIYQTATRARQMSPYHPLRLQLEEELAELGAQLAEVEKYIGAYLPPKRSWLAAPSQGVTIGDLPSAAKAAPVARNHGGYAHADETDQSRMTGAKHDRGKAYLTSSIASLAARYCLAPIRGLHRARALAARAAASGFNSVQRTLETIGESVTELGAIGFRAPGRCTHYIHEIFEHWTRVAERNRLRAVIRLQQAVASGSRLWQRLIEVSAGKGSDVLTFTRNSLRRSGDRLKALSSSCTVAAANLRRPASAAVGQYSLVVVSILHRSSQTVLAATKKSWRRVRPQLLDMSARTSAGLGSWGIAIEERMRRTYAAAAHGATTNYRLLRQHAGQQLSRWAESFSRIVVPRIAAYARTAAGAGRRAAERGGAAAMRSIVAGRRFLKNALATGPIHCRQMGHLLSGYSRGAFERLKRTASSLRARAHRFWLHRMRSIRPL